MKLAKPVPPPQQENQPTQSISSINPFSPFYAAVSTTDGSTEYGAWMKVFNSIGEVELVKLSPTETIYSIYNAPPQYRNNSLECIDDERVASITHFSYAQATITLHSDPPWSSKQ